ncbi:MAG: hypothetical protein ACRDKW_08340, partial [Actinomycetota bacterium]
DPTTASSPSPSPAASPQGPAQIQMVDYGFVVTGPMVQGKPVRFANMGQELHMAEPFKLKEGKTASDVVAALQLPDEAAGEQAFMATMDEVDSVSRGIFGPGSVDVPLDLGPGRYALVCFVPTAGEGMPHALKGMVNEITVVAPDGEAPTPEPADATYSVTKGMAIEGPATLTKGRHVLKIEGANGTEELNPTLVKLTEGKKFGEVVSTVDDLFTAEEPPAKGYLAQWPGELPLSLGDLGTSKSLTLALDLEPGTYVLAVFDTDADEISENPPEQITITVA